MSETAADATVGKIAWFEVPASDSERARSFYRDLLGWQFEGYDGQDYHLSYGAGGAITGSEEVGSPLVFFGVDDIAAAITRVEELGGTGGERQEIAGIGYYAHCQDSEGNRIGLYQDASGR